MDTEQITKGGDVMTNNKENKIIADTIRFLEKGKYAERKQYLKDYYHDGVYLNGFIIQREMYCWLIWKPTDFNEDPQYKGEPLLKIVPRIIDMENIEKVLKLQAWHYI